MVSRTLRRASSLVLTAVFVAGCGSAPPGTPGAPGSPSASSSTAPTNSATPAPQPATVTFWADPQYQEGAPGLDMVKAAGDYERYLAAEFKKLYPHITVNVEINNYDDVTPRMATAIAAGEPPDVIRTSPNRQLEWNKLVPELVYDIKELLPSETLGAFYPDFLRETTAADGKLYAIPTFGQAIFLGGNKGLFDEYGIRYPSDGMWTVEEFEAACEVLKTNGKYCIGDQKASAFDVGGSMALFWSFGGGMLSPDGQSCIINSPESIESLEWQLSLQERGYWIPGSVGLTWDDPLIATVDGTSALYTSANLNQRTRLTNEADAGRAVEGWEWAAFPAPQKPGVNNAGLSVFPISYSAFKTSDDPAQRQAVADFMNYLLSAEVVSLSANAALAAPSRDTAGVPPSDDAQLNMVNEWLTKWPLNGIGLTSPVNAVVPEMWPDWQAIWLGEKSVKDGLDAIQAKCEAALAAG